MKPRTSQALLASLIEVIRKTSCELPKDVLAPLLGSCQAEDEGSRAKYALSILADNVRLAREKSQPICQDTGSILFYIRYPYQMEPEPLRALCRKAVSQATKLGYLRQNSVDSLTGRNSGTNLGPGSPFLHFDAWKKPCFDVRLVLKGGGCENVGVQYSLPDNRLGAGRDLKGVRRCILDAVHQAQGKGCGPGILGVSIGGDRASGYAHSKEQFLRKLNDRNPDPVLARLEEECLSAGNELGVGPMGFGGATTLLGVKVGAINRLPASFFVTVSYMCWAFRRQGARIGRSGSIEKWLY